MNDEELKEMLKLYTKKDLWEFNQIKAKKQIELMAQIKEQDQKIKALENRLSNCIEPKFKLNQEVYAFFTKEEIYKGQIDAFDYYTNTYLIFPNEDIGNEWIPAHLVFKTKKEARKHLEELNNGQRNS